MYDFGSIHFCNSNDPDRGREVVDLSNETKYLTGSGNDVFVIDCHSSEYNWGPTEDGKGIVIWNVATEAHDILYDFGSIRFKDGEVSLENGGDQPPQAYDIEGEAQYLSGRGDNVFVIDCESTEYNWGSTEDGKGIVVWDQETGAHDILYDFGQIAFNDQIIEIEASAIM